MKAASIYQEGFEWASQLLEMVIADITPDQMTWLPPGTANPAGATYAHAICGIDIIVRGMIRGIAPLCQSDWAGKTGISEPQLRATSEWARSVQVDLTTTRSYAQAVYADTNEYMAALTEEDLLQEKDLSVAGLGTRTVGWMLNALVIGHTNNMSGEISALKGLQGGHGYPF